jgi:hypothetical protein
MATVKTPPPRTATPMQYLPVAAMPQHVLAQGWPPLWWVGCHGGAGVSTLHRLTGVGAELGTFWPAVHESWPTQQVVLVARASAAGLYAAAGAVEQARGGHKVFGVRVLGLVVLAATPKRAPKVVTDRIKLLSGWVPHLWQVGWVPALLAVDDPRDVGVPPDVDALRAALGHVLTTTSAGGAK